MASESRADLDAAALAAVSVVAADPDADIVSAIQRGELEPAMRQVMRRHGQAVYRYCAQQLRGSHLVDDVHQRIFIEAHRDLGRFAGRSSLKSWLFGIARHRVLDALKSKQHAVSWDDDLASRVPDPAPTGERRLSDAQLMQALERCLQKLSDVMREAVLLRYQQGLSFREMADALDAEPGTLQKRLERALPALRDCIRRQTGGEP